jgi:hypothetical protein
MAQLKVLTKDGNGRGAVPTQGTQVVVGGQKIDGVTGLSLDAEVSGLWTLTIRVNVEPNALFGVLPQAEA